MATTLLVQGGEIEVDETFNFVRSRINKALKSKVDYEADGGDKYTPAHDLSFKTADGGRIAVSPEKVIGVMSDEPKDVGSGGGDDDEE